MEVKPLNSMGSLQPWLQVVRAVNPSASSQVTRKPCFEYDSVLLFENSSIDRVEVFFCLEGFLMIDFLKCSHFCPECQNKPN